MYRCIHCGGYTGETVEEVNSNMKAHGVGVCVSPCRWCNQYIKHSAHICANVKRGFPLPHMVQDFNEYWESKQ